MSSRSWLLHVACAASLFGASVATKGVDDDWLEWSPARAEAIGKASYVKGRVGRFFDTRLLKTERAYNYKLAATWMTPEVIRASARLEQLHRRLSPDAARALVEAAESAAHTVVMVEIDPREGSGVIPLDWLALLQFDGGDPIAGTVEPSLRELPALAGVLRRNYDYDRFWVSFPLVDADGRSLLPDGAMRASLIVRIHDKEGRVEWPVPRSIQARVEQLRGGPK